MQTRRRWTAYTYIHEDGAWEGNQPYRMVDGVVLRCESYEQVGCSCPERQRQPHIIQQHKHKNTDCLSQQTKYYRYHRAWRIITPSHREPSHREYLKTIQRNSYKLDGCCTTTINNCDFSRWASNVNKHANAVHHPFDSAVRLPTTGEHVLETHADRKCKCVLSSSLSL